jgi:hypothetical protein
MSGRKLNKKETLGIKLVDVDFRFFPNSTTDPAGTIDPGNAVAGIVHTSTGKYTVTLRDQWKSLVGFSATMQLDGDSEDLYATLGDVDLSAKTVVILTKTGSSNADSGAADANQSVSVRLTFQDATIP